MLPFKSGTRMKTLYQMTRLFRDIAQWVSSRNEWIGTSPMKLPSQ